MQSISDSDKGVVKNGNTNQPDTPKDIRLRSYMDNMYVIRKELMISSHHFAFDGS